MIYKCSKITALLLIVTTAFTFLTELCEAFGVHEDNKNMKENETF